jgi:hypothetical protein
VVGAVDGVEERGGLTGEGEGDLGVSVRWAEVGLHGQTYFFLLFPFCLTSNSRNVH